MTGIAIKTLTCPSCGATLKISEGSNHFTCGYCGNSHLMQAAEAPAAPPPKTLRPKVAPPSSVRTIKDGQAVCMVQRWFSAKYIFLAFFALFWDGFLVFWYSMAFGGGAPLIMKLFPIIHVAVGIYVTYSALTGFVNSTNVELSRDELSVWFSPLPWPGEKTVKTSEIKQLYCKEKVKHSSKGGTSITYELHMLNKDDLDTKLISGIDSPDVARYFEQQLETWLRIENQPVEGEM